MKSVKLRKALVLLCYLMIAFPVVLTIFYSFPIADDFSFALTMRKLTAEHGFLSAAWLDAWSNYVKWQGTFLGNILVELFVYDISMNITGMHILLLIVFVMFNASFLFFVRTLVRDLFGIQREGLVDLISLAADLCLFNMDSLSEIVSWLDGTLVYTPAIICMFTGAALCIRYLKEHKRGQLIGGMLLGFLSGGGSLQITALSCSIFLGICLHSFFRKEEGKTGEQNCAEEGKEHRKSRLFSHIRTYCMTCGDFWIFLMSFAGALVNVGAPGNFARHSEIDSTGLQLLPSAVNAVNVMDTNTKRMLFDTIAGVLFLLLIVVLLFMKDVCAEKVSLRKAVAATVYGFFAGVINIFPVLLGYSTANIDSLMRAKNISNMANILIVLMIVLVWTVWAKQHFSIRLGASEAAVLAVVFLLFLISGGYTDTMEKLSTGMDYRALSEFRSGQMQEIYEQNMGFYETMENSKGQDLVLNGKYFSSTIMHLPNYDDANGWEMQLLKKYYGLNSLVVNLERETQ